MPNSNESMISVILSGGAGSRLWPVSRQGHPKPFIKLAKGESLLEKTIVRAKAIGTKTLTITNRDYYFTTLEEFERIGCESDFLLEPFGRNTAPAIAMSAKFVEDKYGSETVIIVLAADHIITDQVEFNLKIEQAAKLAREGYIVTFGILPRSPEVGYGYIEMGDTLGLGYEVTRFVEKPDLETAESYMSSGKYLWNSGMFCFKPSILLEELSKTAPILANMVDICWENIRPITNSKAIEIPDHLFKNIPDISIDYAVMEKSKKLVVIPGNFGWSDVGSWNSFKDLFEPDGSNNRVQGEAILIDTKNTFVKSDNRIVATIGAQDLVIIDTTDALLVAHSKSAQDVKKVVAQLELENHESFRLHRKVTRPWGTYTVLEEAEGFKIKRIEVKPGASLSLQMHHHRSEHWVVVKGVAKVINGNTEIIIKANESTFIPAGQKHRLENPGVDLCVMIEVQCGEYLGEDDIVRFEDRYGR